MHYRKINVQIWVRGQVFRTYLHTRQKVGKFPNQIWIWNVPSLSLSHDIYLSLLPFLYFLNGQLRVALVLSGVFANQHRLNSRTIIICSLAHSPKSIVGEVSLKMLSGTLKLTPRKMQIELVFEPNSMDSMTTEIHFLSLIFIILQASALLSFILSLFFFVSLSRKAFSSWKCSLQFIFEC